MGGNAGFAVADAGNATGNAGGGVSVVAEGDGCLNDAGVRSGLAGESSRVQ